MGTAGENRTINLGPFGHIRVKKKHVICHMRPWPPKKDLLCTGFVAISAKNKPPLKDKPGYETIPVRGKSSVASP